MRSPAQLCGPVPDPLGIGRAIQAFLLDAHRRGAIEVVGAVLDEPGHLVPRQSVSAERDQLGGRHRHRTMPVPKKNVNFYFLTEQIVRYRDSRHLKDTRMGTQYCLDLRRRNVLASPPDYVLDAADEVQVTGGITA